MKMSTVKDLLRDGPVAVNLGLQAFAKAPQDQGKTVVHVDWSPPPPIEKEMQDILEELL